MDSIKEWAVMICSLSVGSAFVSFLIPEGSVKKSVNIVISLFFLTMVILPVFGKNTFNLKIPEISADNISDKEDYLQSFNDFYIDNGELVIRQQIEDILKDVCSDNIRLNISLDVDKNGNILLSGIQIYILNTYSGKIDIIKNKVGSLTGVVPEVIVENENTEPD